MPENDAAPKEAEDVIEARLNKPFLITLDAISTAGYKWTMQFDSRLLKLEEERFQTSETKAIGGRGMQIFRFLPLSLGEARVLASYKRPWENKVEDEREFRIMIRE